MGKTRGKFTYTLIGYALIAFVIAIVGAIVAAGGYWAVVIHRWSPDSVSKWLGLVVFTALMFGWIVKEHKRLWKNKVFWVTVTGLLFLHTASFWVILRTIEHWRVFWFLVICAAEVALFDTVIGWTTDRFGKAHHASRLDLSH